MKLFIVNSGSSSIKWSLYEDEAPLLCGRIERIGQDGTEFYVDGEAIPISGLSDHKTAFEALKLWLGERITSLDAVCHRIVHGGRSFVQATKITPEVLEVLRRLTPLAPEHMPGAILGIEAFEGAAVPIACFDTAFHAHMPEVARRLPLPKELDDAGVCRFGFHGLSYEYVVYQLGGRLKAKTVIAHLGNGCSLAAVLNGKGIDTTMGMTPTGGVPMGRRSGDLDPGVLLYLMRERGYDERGLNRLLNESSGLLGVSQVSSDMKDLLESPKPSAAFAVDFFCYHVRKSIASLAASLGGIDQLVFTGGIGERSEVIREKICEGLHFLGDFEVVVVPTNEELMMVRQALPLLRIERGPLASSSLPQSNL